VIPWWETVARLVLASILGGLIGWDREMEGKPAGLRTQMLVSLSACIFVLAAQQAAAAQGEPVDAVRAMAAVAQGIGFLGAGVVLRARGEVRWLTTAAALWAAAALGLASAVGQYLVAVVGGGLVLFALRGLIVVEERWIKPNRKREQAERKPN